MYRPCCAPSPRRLTSGRSRYYAELKPTCVDAGVDFEERTARRQEEIESLESALQILGGE